MLRENQYILRQVNILLDVVLAVVAVLVAHGVRRVLSMYVLPESLDAEGGWLPGLKPSALTNYLWLLWATPLVTLGALAYHGFYRGERVRVPAREQTRQLALVAVETTVILAALDVLAGGILYPNYIEHTSRAMFFIVPPLLFGLLLVKTVIVHRGLIGIRKRGFNYRRVLLVGSGEPLRAFVRAIEGHPIWGLRIKGVITDRPELQGTAFDAQGVPERDVCHTDGMEEAVVADLTRAPDVLWNTAIDEVIFAPGTASLDELRPLMEICEEMGLRTHLPLNFFDTRIARPVIDRFEDIPILSYWPTRDIGPALLFKYAFDRVAAAVLLMVLAVPMLGVALAIRMGGPKGAPVFFGQRRVGLNGREFTCWKFRSMHPDAEKMRAELEALNEQQGGPAFKMKHDPRITKLGRWLRKFSIDELPQLWNVVKGDMSLVGPRPPLPAEIQKYDRWQRRRLSMKPGITCLWQVSGRNQIDFETWMKLDLEYIDNWNLTLDFKILARTVYVVATGYGAM